MEGSMIDKKEFRKIADEEFEKSFADKKDWITTLSLAGIDEQLLKAKLKDCFVDGMKYGVKLVKKEIT
jgi:hypothetical protein